MLSEARHKQLLSSLNSTAKKVYEVVPIVESWTVKQIGIQLHRDGTPQSQDVLLACLDTMRRAGLITQQAGCFQRVGVRRKKAHSLADLGDVVRSGIDELKEVVHEALHPPTPYEPPAPLPPAPLGGLPSPPRPAPPMPPVQPAKPETKAPMTATTTQSDVVETLSGLSQSMHALILSQQREREELDSRHRGALAALAHAVADAGIEVQGALEAGSEEVQAARQLKALLGKIG